MKRKECKTCGNASFTGDCTTPECIFETATKLTPICKNRKCRHFLLKTELCPNPDCFYSSHFQEEKDTSLI